MWCSNTDKQFRFLKLPFLTVQVIYVTNSTYFANFAGYQYVLSCSEFNDKIDKWLYVLDSIQTEVTMFLSVTANHWMYVHLNSA